jgi:2-polyprenylphenol 6-hydroxylase
MSRDFDVVIVGAGAVGSVMAALLMARKQASPGSVAIVDDPAGREGRPAEPGAAADWDHRVFALSRASQRLLQSCGAWQLLPQERVFAYERMCVWDAGGTPEGRGSLTFDCAEIGEPNLGFIVDGRALNEACRRAAGAAGAVAVEASVRSIALGSSCARVGLADGRELDAKLLIAADGASSKTRELLGIETAGHAYHQDALVAHVRTAAPHRATAWQRFLATGPLAFLPLPDGRCSIVWSAERAEADRLRALDAAGFEAELLAASAGILGCVELLTRVASYPLQLQYALAYARPRAVLLGDAAHTIHPLAGQGLNLGLLDCASLAEELGEAADPDLLGDYRLLRRYERRRKSENLIAAAALDGLQRLFASPSATVGRLRSAGLEGVGKLPYLKRRLVRRALGLAGDVPAFLKFEGGVSLTADRAWPRR